MNNDTRLEDRAQGSSSPGGEQPHGAAEVRGRLLRVEASCPRCGSRPALRVTEALSRALRAEGGRMRIGTFQCQRRGCGAIYDLFAKDCLPEG